MRPAAFCLLCFLLSRVVVLGVAYAAFYSQPEPPAPPGYAETQGPLDRRPLNVLFYYDAVHYLRIAREGYSWDETPWYPLYPLAVRLFGGTAASAVAVSNIAFFAGLLALQRIAGKRAVALACASPIGVTFSSAYSESLFFCLTAWALALRDRRPLAAGFLCGAAAMTRAPGVALILVPLAKLLRDRSIRDVAAVLLAIIGAATYPVYLWLKFGSPATAAAVNAEVFRRILQPFWYGMIADGARLFAGGFSADAVPVALLNLVGGAVWLAFGLAGPQPTAAAAYALTVLSFPVQAAAWPPATHGLLRYACVWPGAYAGIARFSRSPLAIAGVTAGSFCAAVLVSALVAYKAFIF